MFESIEQLVEDSVNLNYKLYPVVMGMAEAMKRNPNPEYHMIGEDLKELVGELQSFLSKLELSADEDGGIDFSEFESRKVH